MGVEKAFSYFVSVIMVGVFALQVLRGGRRVLAAAPLVPRREHLHVGELQGADAKKALFDVIWERLAPFRARREELAANPDHVQAVLRDGAARARAEAARTLAMLTEMEMLAGLLEEFLAGSRSGKGGVS